MQRFFDASGDEVEGGSALHDEGLARVVGEYERRRVVGRIVAPPSLPRVVGPGAADRAEHVAAEDEGAEVIHRPVREFVVQIDGAISVAVHRAEGFCVKEPLKDFGTAEAKRVVQALFGPGTEAIQ